MQLPSKTCVFCGNVPHMKNREHVIPKWLINMTGEASRNAVFNNSDGKERVFDWKSFKFPACTKCNSDSSILEESAKEVISKLIGKESLNSTEINILLDWLDKIRIGLWLGQIMLDKVDYMKPSFHIKNRIGSADRMVTINYSSSNEKRLNYSGVNFKTFLYNPSCFSLRINNLILISLSNQFLFGRRLGFFYPQKLELVDGEGGNELLLASDFVKGTERVTLPILRKLSPIKSLRFFQFISQDKNVWDSFKGEYYSKHIVLEGFKSDIFVENDFENKAFFLNGLNCDLKCVNEITNDVQYKKLLIWVLELQVFLLSNSPIDYSSLSPDAYASRKLLRQTLLKGKSDYIKYLKNKWLNNYKIDARKK